MKLFSLLLFLLGLALASCNILQFGAMITQMTGKLPGAYNGYGCYCGLGGTKQPLDATDRCCHTHDCCYRRAIAAGCRPKSDIYKYTFRGKRITCGSGTSCERRICACDKAAAECFKRTAGSYRKSYANYPQSKCKGRAPSC